MPVSASLLDALRDVLDFVPDLRVKRMFGGVGLWSGDLIFGFAVEDALYLKTDHHSKADFEVLGLEPFVTRGRPTSYLRAPDEVWEDGDAARVWVERALAAARRKAGSQPANPPTTARTAAP